jgi:hypothetical protein
MEAPRTFTLDGISYDVEQFSPGVQQAIGIYHHFNNQLSVERLAVIKTEAALASVGKQIAEAASKELEAKRQAAAAPQEPANDPEA